MRKEYGEKGGWRKRERSMERKRRKYGEKEKEVWREGEGSIERRRKTDRQAASPVTGENEVYWDFSSIPAGIQR